MTSVSVRFGFWKIPKFRFRFGSVFDFSVRFFGFSVNRATPINHLGFNIMRKIGEKLKMKIRNWWQIEIGDTNFCYFSPPFLMLNKKNKNAPAVGKILWWHHHWQCWALQGWIHDGSIGIYRGQKRKSQHASICPCSHPLFILDHDLQKTRLKLLLNLIWRERSELKFT